MVRCWECDKWGWVRNPADRFGPEIPCPVCDGQGHVEDEGAE
jgi:hypothetical protein